MPASPAIVTAIGMDEMTLLPRSERMVRATPSVMK